MDIPANTFFGFSAYNCHCIGVRYFDDQKEKPPAPDRELSLADLLKYCTPLGNDMAEAAVKMTKRLNQSPSNVPVYLFWLNGDKPHLMWYGTHYEFTGFAAIRYNDIRVAYKSGDHWITKDKPTQGVQE